MGGCTGWLCHSSNCRKLAFALQAVAKGNSEAEFLYKMFPEVLEEVRNKALALEKNKGSGPKATGLKTAVDAGASSSSQEPRFDKRHEAKAAAVKAKSGAADRKALHSKYAAAAENSGSGDGTGSDGDDSLDQRLKSGRALSTEGKQMALKKEKPVVLNMHTVVHISAASLEAAGVPSSSAVSVYAEIASRPGKPIGQVCTSGFLRRAAASLLCVIICPCFGFVATR